MSTAAIQPLAIVEKELRPAAGSLEQRVLAIQIIDQDSYNEMASIVKEAVAWRKAVKDRIAVIKEPQYRAYKETLRLETELLELGQKAEADGKRKLIAWDQEQERLRQEEQRRLEEEARKRDEEDRLRAAEAAQAEGCSDDLIDAILEEEAPATAVVAPPTYQRTAGISKPSFRYSAKIVDLIALARYVVANPADQGFLVGIRRRVEGPGFECPAVNSRANVQKELFQLPGCELIKTATLAVRG